MAHASLNREWHMPISAANFGVGEGPPAVQFAQEGPPVLGLQSTAVPGVGDRRQYTCFLIASQFQRCSRPHWEQNSNAEESCWLQGHVGDETSRYQKPMRHSNEVPCGYEFNQTTLCHASA